MGAANFRPMPHISPVIRFGTGKTIAGTVTAGVHVGGVNVSCVEYIDPCGIAGSNSVLAMGTLSWLGFPTLPPRMIVKLR